MRWIAISLITLFSTLPSLAYALDGVEWMSDACEEILGGYPSTFDSNLYQSARRKNAQIQNAADWIGEKPRFEEALSIVEQHLKLVAPDQAEAFRKWVEDAFKKEGLIAIQHSGRTSIKRSSFWRRFSFNTSVRTSKFVLSWNQDPIRNEADLFEMEQKIILLLGRTKFQNLSAVSTALMNTNEAAQQMAFQYWLKGETGVQPSNLQVANESLRLMKSLSFRMVWPKKNLPSRLKPIHQWILDHYGTEGLTRYFYFKFGPGLALGFLVNAVAKLTVTTALVFTLIHFNKVTDVVEYYNKAGKIEVTTPAEQKVVKKIIQTMSADPQKVVKDAEESLFSAPKDDPKSDADTLIKPALSPQELDRLKKMLDQVKKELQKPE